MLHDTLPFNPYMVALGHIGSPQRYRLGRLRSPKRKPSFASHACLRVAIYTLKLRGADEHPHANPTNPQINNDALSSIPSNFRVLDGLFQAFAVRSGGFYVVNISQLRVGLLVLYVLMMYISVYPVVITMRNSNVYEERSLGIYADDPAVADASPSHAESSLLKSLKRRFTRHRPPAPTSIAAEPRGYFVRQQLRGQLAHDLWWIVLAVLFITITETGQFEADPVTYSVFNVIFEVISAYGCVGISIGLPGQDYSFSGGWHVLSKLILCAVMIRGRHRGLPVAIDRAVLLPGEGLGAAEEEDAQIRFERTISRGTPGG